MNAKQNQLGKLRAAALELERKHELALFRARQARTNDGPIQNADKVWERDYATRHKALTDAMAVILASDDGDKAAYDTAMEAQA